MDVLYGSDQKLGEMEDSDMTDFLDGDMFNTSMTPDNYMDNEWLNCFFDDPVLNDKMITDAAQPPCIKSEHSYSLNDQSPGSPLGLAKIEDIDADFLAAPSAMDLTHKNLAANETSVTLPGVKQEALASDPLLTSSSPPCSTASLKQPTIILAKQSTPHTADQPVFPQITIKQEPADTFENTDQAVTLDQMILPPTPPSSASSDSEGSQSPQRSAPSSPVHQQTSRQAHHLVSSSTSKALSQPLFVNPIPQTGVLILSEEEKRTLVSEGYPIPGKLPLTKQEEKNLKKIRRKIKNKISAQESRRKKKEYLEALEKRVESFNQENTDLKKKIDSLENNNRSLLGQLHKLQALVSKMPRPSTVSQTGTVLMVLVLCFAVFLGSWSPTSLNIGYSSGSSGVSPVFLSKPEYIRPAPEYGPSIANAKVHGDYATPHMKSRMLLSLREDQEDMSDEVRAFYPWDRTWCQTEEKDPEPEMTHQQENPTVATISPESINMATKVDIQESVPSLPPQANFSPANETQDQQYREYQATMHPDIAVAPVEFRSIEPRGNITAEIETA